MPGLHTIVVCLNPVGQLEQQRKNVLSHRVCAVSNGVTDVDLPLPGLFHIDVIVAGCRHTDTLKQRQPPQLCFIDHGFVYQNDLSRSRPLGDLFGSRVLKDAHLPHCPQFIPTQVARIEGMAVQHDDLWAACFFGCRHWFIFLSTKSRGLAFGRLVDLLILRLAGSRQSNLPGYVNVFLAGPNGPYTPLRIV